MRLTKITTRTGDNGETGLADGTRVAKDHARIMALGSLDELNSHLGLLLTEELSEDFSKLILKMQNDLFDLGGALATPGNDVFPESRVLWLDEQIVHFNSDLPPLREFILPGGSRAGALCHVARTVARRSERELVALKHVEKIPQHAIPYMNRASDLLFILSRCINRNNKTTETLWQRTQ